MKSAFTALWATILAMFVAVANGAEGTPAAASYRVNLANGIGGSATGIAPKLVVTNAHVATQSGLRATIKHYLTGEITTGRVFARDTYADLALILTDEEVTYVRVDPLGIDSDKPIYKFGYGSGRNDFLVWIKCKLLHRRGEFKNRKGRFATLSTPSVSGDSGGGLFQDGKLVGVLWGSDDTSGRNGSANSVGSESRYLFDLAARFDEKHDTPVQVAIFGQRCPPGDYG